MKLTSVISISWIQQAGAKNVLRFHV